MIDPREFLGYHGGGLPWALSVKPLHKGLLGLWGKQIGDFSLLHPQQWLSQVSEWEDHRPVLQGAAGAALLLAVQEGARRGQDFPGIYVTARDKSTKEKGMGGGLQKRNLEFISRSCMDWKFVSPKFIRWNRIPSVMVSGGGNGIWREGIWREGNWREGN